MRAQDINLGFAEIRQLFRETDALIKENAKELRRLEGLFGNQWGTLIEALVAPNALKLFHERGIDVQQVYPRAKSTRNGEHMEVDLLLANGKETVVVEVKSTVQVHDVRDLLATLERFPRFFPHHPFRRHTYGAIAGLSFEEDSDRYAYHQGLFVLGVIGEGIMQIRNDARFTPKDFGKSISPE